MVLASVLVLAGMGVAVAQEAVIRKNLIERIPQLGKIVDITKSPIAGLYEVRIDDNQVYYADVEGNYLVSGQIIETKSRRNLTEERLSKLNAIEFKSLPLKDAITINYGKGGGAKRQLAVFEDPNCGYCKRFERDMLDNLKDVTVHLFLLPILGPDSLVKSKGIWCAKEQAQAWQNWMVRSVAPGGAGCDTSALDRNVALAQKYRINGTPTMVFMDGRRVPGAASAKEVERMIAEAAVH